jgi:Zn-dependent M28 family amino/carboxypeptidase
MFWTPRSASVGPLQPLNAHELRLESQLRHVVEFLAGSVGERNIPDKREQLEEAAQFIDSSLRAAGYRPQSQWYNIGSAKCRNIEAEIRGAGRPGEVVIVGAHYDSAPESPGADDNASGVAAMLALARSFAGTRPARTLRFVGFTNEEPPYFWRDEMGSLVYAKKCRRQGDRVVAMLSIESVGFYSTSPASQHYPAGLSLLYPSTGDFVAFVGNILSRSLVHETLRVFRGAGALPSVGAAVPNAIPGAGWSDHWSFWQQGFPGIEITDTALYRNPYYHTPQDTPDRLDYDRLTRFTWAMQAVIGQLSH